MPKVQPRNKISKWGVISETFDGRALRKSSVLSENQKMENCDKSEAMVCVQFVQAVIMGYSTSIPRIRIIQVFKKKNSKKSSAVNRTEISSIFVFLIHNIMMPFQFHVSFFEQLSFQSKVPECLIK